VGEGRHVRDPFVVPIDEALDRFITDASSRNLNYATLNKYKYLVKTLTDSVA
jgi:hypothetical protein